MDNVICVLHIVKWVGRPLSSLSAVYVYRDVNNNVFHGTNEWVYGCNGTKTVQKYMP